MNVAGVEAVSRRLGPVDVDVHVVARDAAFGESASGARYLLHDPLRPLAERLQRVQVRTEDLDADRGPDAGGQHVDAALDRHRPGVGDPGKLDGPVQLGDEPVVRHPGPPLVLRLQRDRGLEHVQRGRVGRRPGPPGLTEHRLDLRKRGQHAVLIAHDLA